MKKIFLLSAILGVLIFSLSSIVYAVATWEETQPGGNADFSWTPSAMSSDGQKMIVGDQAGTLYLSSDRGNSWDVIDPSGGAGAPDWLTTSMSSDGQIILAGIYGAGGRLYRSTDGGSNWSEVQPAGDSDHDWGTTSMSTDGQIMLAGTRNSGRLYMSVNGGTDWSEVQPAGDTDQSWGTTNMSSNGQVMVAGVINGRLYLSIDAGSNWSEIQPSGDQDQQWYSVGMSSNGQVILVGDALSPYLSKNTGNTWSQVYPAGVTDKRFPISSVSSDGQTMFTGGEDRLYISSDGGDNWSQTQPAGDSNYDWALGGMSSDSQVLLAGVYNGRLYLGSNPLPSPTSGGGSQSSSGNSNSTPTCTSIPGAPDLFQISSNKSSATLYFAPISGSSNYLISYGMNTSANQYTVITDQGDSGGVQSFTVNDLPANTNIYFKVSSQNNCGQGSWSNTMQVKTSGGVYYKNFETQIINSLMPSRATPLKVASEKTPVQTKVGNVPKNPTVPSSNNQTSSNIKSSVPKKSCFLFFCW